MPGKPIAQSGELCPYFRKDVSKVCHKCHLYDHVMGNHPQTGEHVDYWACSIKLHTMLMIENSGMQRQTGAAVESFRNEMVKANETNLRILGNAYQQRNAISSQQPRIRSIESGRDNGSED